MIPGSPDGEPKLGAERHERFPMGLGDSFQDAHVQCLDLKKKEERITIL